MGEPYKNAPLIEAVFEIRFPPELSIECQRYKYYNEIRKQFPNVSLPPIDSPEPYPLKGYRFETSDTSELIQFSLNRFSYHCKRYETFEKFKDNASKYIGSFCKHFNVFALNRTGLRYINHIPFKRENGGVPLSKFLKIGFVTPETIPDQMELFQTILLTRMNDGKLRILIASREPSPKTEIILLDFDFSFEGDLSVDALQEYLNQSHLHTKKIFLSLLTDGYKHFLEEGK